MEAEYPQTVVPRDTEIRDSLHTPITMAPIHWVLSIFNQYDARAVRGVGVQRSLPKGAASARRLPHSPLGRLSFTVEWKLVGKRACVRQNPPSRTSKRT